MIGREELSKQLLTASDDFKADIKSYASYISSSSLNFIHSDELILTVGHSKTVYSFLKVKPICNNIKLFSMRPIKTVNSASSYVKPPLTKRVTRWQRVSQAMKYL